MKRLLIILNFIVSSLILIGCQTNKVDIMTSGFFNYDIVKQITKDTKLSVGILTEPGRGSEHSVGDALSAKKTYQLKNAAIFVYTSNVLDDKILDNKNNLPSQTFNIFKAIFPDMEDHAHDHDHDEHEHNHEGHHHNHDLIHYWTSVQNIIKAINETGKKLAEIFKDNQEIVNKNTKAYAETLTKVKNDFHSFLEGKEAKKIVYLAHDAMGAFAKEFKLNYKPFHFSLNDKVGENAAKIQEIVKLLKDEKITTVFLPELNSGQKLYDAIKKELPDLKGLSLSGMHNISSEEFAKGITYLNILEENINNIKTYLN